jgi:hypothetical protein
MPRSGFDAFRLRLGFIIIQGSDAVDGFIDRIPLYALYVAEDF